MLDSTLGILMVILIFISEVFLVLMCAIATVFVCTHITHAVSTAIISTKGRRRKPVQSQDEFDQKLALGEERIRLVDVEIFTLQNDLLQKTFGGQPEHRA